MLVFPLDSRLSLVTKKINYSFAMIGICLDDQESRIDKNQVCKTCYFRWLPRGMISQGK